jgi:predicted nucleic acid-binding protein
VTEHKLIDSSVWLAYFFNGKGKEIIESEEQLLVSTLSLFEIKRVLMKKEVSFGKIKEYLEFLKNKSITLTIDEKTAEKASEISIKSNLPSIDSLIYSTAMLNNAVLITLDNDFRGLPGAKIL